VFFSMCWFVTREHRLDYSPNVEASIYVKLIGRLIADSLASRSGSLAYHRMVPDLSQQLFEKCL
jgi:hypothetical protein